jgi:hypothetical protein
MYLGTASAAAQSGPLVVDQGARLAVDYNPMAGEGASVTINPTSPVPVRWCLQYPSQPDSLTVGSDGTTATVPYRDMSNSGPCSTKDLSVVILLANGNNTQETKFLGVSELDIGAEGPKLTVKGISGSMQLSSGGPFTVNPLQQESLSAGGGEQFRVVLGSGATGPELSFSSPKVTSAVVITTIDGTTASTEQLVGSWWDRNNNLALPLFLALCGTAANLVFPFADLIRKALGRGPAEAKAK